MAALTGARNTNMPSGGDPVAKTFSIGLAANAKVYEGAIVVFDPSTGYATQGKTAAGLIALGRAEAPPFGALPAFTPPGLGAQVYDNTGGANGLLVCSYRQGVFAYANSSAGDLIAVTNIGSDCYIVDDQTVALTDGVGTRSRAGKIMGVDATGNVIVQMGVSLSGPSATSPISIVTLPLDFPTLANGGQQFQFTPGFAGRIKSIQVAVRKPVTTAAKSANITAQVGGISVTGGLIALTSANATPAGASVPGTAITAGGSFTAAQTIGVIISGVTTFVEGDGSVIFVLG
jgi:hypothetical protein